MKRVGVVVIGRNEGRRLDRTLRAALAVGSPVVYADSGSEDDSVEIARSLHVAVVDVSPTETGVRSAARGRNVGLEALRARCPELGLVQFVDGDTELDPAWLGVAAAALRADPSLAGVCGELVERDAEKNVHRMLLGLEWRGPVGDIEACGGNAMYRLEALDDVAGFRESLVGGEEADLCARLRAAGGRIARLPARLGTHDSGIDTFALWWRRVARVGRSQVGIVRDETAHDDGAARRELLSATFWGAALPLSAVVALAGATVLPELALITVMAALAWSAQALRIAARTRRSGVGLGDALHYGFYCLVSKSAVVAGAVRA